MKKIRSGIRATMGTLSGAETMSQSCRQSISSPMTLLGRLLLRASLGLLHFRLQHDWRGAGDAAVLANTPEVHDHQHRRHDRNADAVPDVRTKQGIGIYD